MIDLIRRDVVVPYDQCTKLIHALNNEFSSKTCSGTCVGSKTCFERPWILVCSSATVEDCLKGAVGDNQKVEKATVH